MPNGRVRGLILVPYLLGLLVVLPVHAGVSALIDGCGLAPPPPSTATGFGISDPAQDAPCGRPLSKHDESSCTVCALGGHVLISTVAGPIVDSVGIPLRPTTVRHLTGTELLAPSHPRAPPARPAV